MTPLNINFGRSVKTQYGFSMIEVLVTMLVVSLALLGAAGLQAFSIRLNQGGQFRTQAVFLAADLAERMEANKTGAVAGSYAIAMPTTATNCLTTSCTSLALAKKDLFEWQQAVALALPQGTATSPIQTITGNPSTYTITISWVDRKSRTKNGTYDSTVLTGINSTGTGERFFYTATRTVLN